MGAFSKMLSFPFDPVAPEERCNVQLTNSAWNFWVFLACFNSTFFPKQILIVLQYE